MNENEYAANHARSVGAANFYVLTGCSGGGKSTLLSELDKRGYRVFPEPGRQIVKEQQSVGGDGLPWKNKTKFAELCVSRAMYFYNSAILLDKPVFFDRSMIDNISGIERLGLPMPVYFLATLVQYRYANRVFMVPPCVRSLCRMPNDSTRIQKQSRNFTGCNKHMSLTTTRWS